MSTTPGRPWRSALAAAVTLGVLSFVAVEPPATQREREAAAFGGSGQSGSGTTGGTTGGTGTTAGTGTTGGTGTSGGTGATGGTAGRGSSTVTKGGKKLECRAGANGGSTDTGVSGSKIKLAATSVRSGSGSSFLGSSPIGMQAVVNKVNAQGGICGRLLELRVVDDGWDAQRGAGFIANFSKGDYFAMPVVPSSEGLTQAIVNGTINRSGMPVVGTDGMLKDQYFSPWVWPVATATVSTMRAMAKHAHAAGARSFGIIYDKQYRFGVEGAEAFRQYVRTLPDASMRADVGIQPGKPSYSGDAEQFNSQCGPDRCDFVAMLLDPSTAKTYIKSQSGNNGFGRILTGGAQPLFSADFAKGCGRQCDQMLVWTGYNPPIGRLASTPDVATYVRDVRSVDPDVDYTNQFLEGSYLGMSVFVEALRKVGPNLTREALRDALNSMSYTSSLSSPLKWTQQQRFANQCAQAFRVIAPNSFSGFAESGSGYVCDPTPGVVPKV